MGVIRVDWDAGVTEGRQLGRGESGDQWRDDFRADYDVARGGQGRNLLRKIDGQPGKQVYVGKRKQDHGRFGKKEDAPDAASQDWGAAAGFGGGFGAEWGLGGGFAGLPMQFGPAPAFGAFGFDKGKGKGKFKGKGKDFKGKGKPDNGIFDRVQEREREKDRDRR